jgi:[ribosomal protein S18]-alanine N-acetyltransferase
MMMSLSLQSNTQSSQQQASGCIKRMQLMHLDGVMAIESVSFGPHHWSADAFKNELSNPQARYYSLLLQDMVIGYCGYWVLGEEMHINTLAVAPSHRGQRWGEILVAMVLDQAMGHSIHWITLEVRASNALAINLYNRYGFQSQGLRPKYYIDNNEDAVIMTTSDVLTSHFRALYHAQKAHLLDYLSSHHRGLPQGFEGYHPILSSVKAETAAYA